MDCNCELNLCFNLLLKCVDAILMAQPVIKAVALNVMDRKMRATIKMDRDSMIVPMFTSETRLK